jgi:amino acid transporter
MQMYWLTRLDGIKCALEVPALVIVVIATIYAVVIIAGLLVALEWNDEDDKKNALKKLKTVGVLSFASFLLFTLSALVPSTKEMAAILIVPRIANSEKIQQTGNKIYDFAVEWMDELKPKKAKKTDK